MAGGRLFCSAPTFCWEQIAGVLFSVGNRWQVDGLFCSAPTFCWDQITGGRVVLFSSDFLLGSDSRWTGCSVQHRLSVGNRWQVDGLFCSAPTFCWEQIAGVLFSFGNRWQVDGLFCSAPTFCWDQITGGQVVLFSSDFLLG